ncbi:MAG: helix-turn-helix domain-containing protein [Pseudobutyrivibrio sp.]|nr:helix-turn-helix domain-containing protein [Pseudobutyrivibrio sp.]
MAFAENLQTIRKQKNLSQEGLAELLGVSRQAVSKWELGEGYPEVEKLLVIAKELDVSLDSLMGTESINNENTGSSSEIRIYSPNEGITLSTSVVTRSPEFKTGKNSPKFALFASSDITNIFGGSQNRFLGWYKNIEDISNEIQEINTALESGTANYTLKYSVKCKKSFLKLKIDE